MPDSQRCCVVLADRIGKQEAVWWHVSTHYQPERRKETGEALLCSVLSQTDICTPVMHTGYR